MDENEVNLYPSPSDQEGAEEIEADQDVTSKPDSWAQIWHDLCELLSKGGPFFNGR